MGKDSLLESTSKKKSKAKKTKGKAAKKVAAPKGKAKKTVAKAKAKPKGTPAKKVAAKAAKAPVKAKKTAAQKKAPAKTKPAKKPTLKELRFKKFDRPPAKTLYSPPAKTGESDFRSPSYFAGMSDATVVTAKAALKRKFDWEAIKAAGEKYAAEMTAKAEEEAKRKAEEEAKRKAEEEAQRKAEEEAKRKAEEEAKRKAEEEAKRKAEAEAAAPPPAAADADAAAGKPMKLGLIAFGAVLLLLIMSSYSNTKKYYITEKDGAVTIERGTFTPMGTTVLITMTDVPMPEPLQDVYGWQDAYRLMYQHYINAADKLLEAPGVPDAAALATQLGMAVKYAPNRELREDARTRLVGMRLQVLVHKAQAAMQRRTIESAQAALVFLKEAADLDLSEGEAGLVKQRTAEAEKLLADLEAAQAEAERQAAEEAALADEAQKLKETAATSQAADTNAP